MSRRITEREVRGSLHRGEEGTIEILDLARPRGYEPSNFRPPGRASQEQFGEGYWLDCTNCRIV
jgi:hypothetical protein